MVVLYILGNTWLKFIIYHILGEEKKSKKQNKFIDASTFCRETKKVEAILILDLHNSSMLANLYGDEIALALTENLNDLALPVFSKNKASFSKGTGDGFLVSFEKAEKALDSALTILKKVVDYNQSEKKRNAYKAMFTLWASHYRTQWRSPWQCHKYGL